MSKVEQDVVLRLERRFAAPRERVFDAWTNADVLRDWWAASPTMEPGDTEVDLREGGSYRLAMKAEDGQVHVVGGTYREVRRPERLVYTWTWESNAPEMEGSADSVVEVDFAEDGDGTTVTLVHRGFANDEIRALHEHGWNGIFDSLERLLSK